MLRDKIETKSTRDIWVEYREGFRVKLRYVPREHLRKIIERCQRVEWDHKTHQKKETSLDQRKWAHLFAEEVFLDWEGLTPEMLRSMIEMKEYPAGAVPFSIEDCEELLYHAYDFDVWAQELCADLAAFEAVADAERKKSSAPSPGMN